MIDQEKFERLAPLAYQWAKQQEAYILQHGAPLAAHQLADAGRVGVQYPDRVRVLVVDRIPLPDDEELAVLEVHDFREGDHLRLPFNQPSGSQSAQLGPVLKRTVAKGKKEESGPSLKIQETTLKQFEAISKQGRPWSPYFSRAAACFRRKKLHDLSKGELKSSEETSLSLAIRLIGEKVLPVLRGTE